MAAQKLSGTSGAQRVLENAIARATDDTFAVKLLEGTENPSRNHILTDYSHVDVSRVKTAFIQRMRKRYAHDLDGQSANIAQGDWYAFRLWVQNSEDDQEMEQQFWHAYIGSSRKRLAQAINFIYPGNVHWSDNPTPAVNLLFPLTEFAQRLSELRDDGDLDENEKKGLARMQDLIDGKYRPWPEGSIAGADSPQVID